LIDCFIDSSFSSVGVGGITVGGTNAGTSLSKGSACNGRKHPVMRMAIIIKLIIREIFVPDLFFNILF